MNNWLIALAISLTLPMLSGQVRAQSVNERLDMLIEYYDYEDASPREIIRLADSVIALEGKCEAFWRRGWAHQALENWEESMNDMKKAIEYGCAKGQWAWYVYGRAMFQIDGLERRSLGPITKSINLAYEEDLGNKEKSMAYELRGLVRVWLGNQGDGCRDLQKAASLGSQKATKTFNNECGRTSSIPSSSGYQSMPSSQTPSLARPRLRETLSDTPFQWKQ